MAELNTTSRNRKETPKVDLTAMVDLAFLLITFFMLTTSLAKQNAMDIVKPDENDESDFNELPASRTMTILLGKNNKVAWYMGEAGKSRPYIDDYKQIRKSILINKMKLVSGKITDKKSLIVVIKPTSGATYKNFVDIMDELSIAKITTAPSIDDDHITEAEKAFMKERQIL
ncbi:outer membrane transport energization protein ExbD [Pedobacter westerhofensis]|uniref:Outer membrane transport energization protein ExbD n=1 Tax=Pedobacter westerhofensis TaxID=425512 RepID=A0A521ECJ1_9SPHI|nr:biopolymer transporter ExbD [Pedobacter westerhofensis]SMO80900.1 outer membrane transport energization protein ExbD [Pedobacter westerhofensis]